MTQEIQETLIEALQLEREEINDDLGRVEAELHSARREAESMESLYNDHRRKYDEILNALQFVLNATPSS
jgi:chromosome segregation ATPase